VTLKLAVGLPAYRGQICAAQSIMWAQFGGACARQPDEVQVVMFAHVDTCGIDRARNALVRQATVAKAQWLLMVDSDTHALAGKDLLRMILEHPADAAVVGAPVIRRGDRSSDLPNLWRWTGERHESHDPRRQLGHGANGPYLEIDAVGAAILAIDLRRVAAARAEFRWADGMSEDLWFSRQLRVAGEKIYVDPRVATVHLGQPEILIYDPNSAPPSGSTARSGEAGP
jgi:hypothetical protein